MKREGRVLDAELETEDARRGGRVCRRGCARPWRGRTQERRAVRRALDAAGVHPAEVTSLDTCHACR